MEHILNNLGYNEFVCLDVETTSFTSAYGDILEIGAVKIKDGVIVDTFNQLIKPRKAKKIPKKIVELTGITDEMIADKPYIEEVLPALHKFIGNRVVVGHNVAFDWDKMLKVFFKTIGIIVNNETIDTIKLAKCTLTEKKKGFKLGELCEDMNIELINAHRALDDAKATAELFNKLRELYKESFKPLIYVEHEAEPKSINCTIKKVSYWVKEKPKTKRIEHQRHYVNLFYNGKFVSVYYDISNDCWYVNPKFDITETLDFTIIEEGCIKFLRLQSKEDFISYRN